MTVDEALAKLEALKAEDPDCGNMEVTAEGKGGKKLEQRLFCHRVESFGVLERLLPGENPREAHQRRLRSTKEEGLF